MNPRTTNRRDFFAGLFRPLKEVAVQRAEQTSVAASAPAVSLVAIVQGRFCLAYQSSFCSTCVERCPVPGAITVEQGLPRINASVCTGCRVCHEVCPAPRNAILLAPRRPARVVPVS